MTAPTKLDHLTTRMLEIGFNTAGESGAPAVLLLHGWPDDPTTWDRVSPALNAKGFRTIAPWLRGFGPTRFLSADSIRDGSTAALAQDAIDLMDGLGIDRFAVVGHDWGARIAYALAAVIPERLTSITALSVGYTPRGAFPVPPFRQSRAWWYQWFMSVDRGAEAVARDPKGFARIQWETWSPPGWFDDADFERTAQSFENPDWLAITLSSYRSRWRNEPRDPQYDALQEQIAAVETLTVPTLMIQGDADGTVLPESTEGKEGYFAAAYWRLVIEGVGHFPTREAPLSVARAILEHLDSVPAK
jgi:pimeloyl-ACP methyl ester carboxylesterase